MSWPTANPSFPRPWKLTKHLIVYFPRQSWPILCTRRHSVQRNTAPVLQFAVTATNTMSGDENEHAMRGGVAVRMRVLCLCVRVWVGLRDDKLLVGENEFRVGVALRRRRRWQQNTQPQPFSATTPSRCIAILVSPCHHFSCSSGNVYICDHSTRHLGPY